MTTYTPPVDDLRFTMNHVCDLDRILDYPAYAHADRDTIDGLLEEAARFFGEVLAPVNAAGDTEGCSLSPDGVVTVPASFGEPYKRYVEGTFAPTRIAWSYDNRTVGFRVVGAGPIQASLV